MQDRKPSTAILPDGDDDFHMADTDQLETLGAADTDVLEKLKDEHNSEGDRGFDPYNNTGPSSKKMRSRS